MRLTFLSAAIPLTKTLAYSPRDDEYTTTPYPMVSRVTSHEDSADDMLQFANVIRRHGELGRCLMFGTLDQPLKDESRAGHSVKAPHEWVCFDFDKVDCAPTVAGAMFAISEYLPEACSKAECVIQLSPSCYNPRATKLSAHVFFRLSTPVDASVLKEWITRINFDKLPGQIRLTDSGNALSFALDRCVTDASRLIYIAPPKCVGFEPTVPPEDAIVHLRGTPTITVPHFTPVTREEINQKINELREENLLPRREFRTTRIKDMEMLLEPGECQIHDIRTSGDGYIRFNINGGDSQAYWINLRQPQIIGNFKGEPYMYTKEANPQFYKSLVKSLQAMPTTNTGTPALDVLAFYATNRGSKVYVGTYDRQNDVLRVEASTESAAFSWMKQFGVPIKTNFPHYDLAYDISSDIRYEEGYPVINLYARTDFIKDYSKLPRSLSLDSLDNELRKECPVIHRTLASVTGDPRSLVGLVNWLAYIFQERKMTETAWLLHGTEGTGKGMLINKIMKPLLGDSSVTSFLAKEIDSGFNGMLEGKLLVNVDEVAMSRTRDKTETMARLRHWITEKVIFINNKGVNQYETESYANFIFTSNDMRPLAIPEGDRRFHVGTRQETRLMYSPNEIAVLEQGEELPAFAKIMGELIVDEAWVRNPEKSTQKAQLFENTHSLLDRVGFALRDGDTTFLFEARPSPLMRQVASSNTMLPLRQYDEILQAILDGTMNVLTPEDLFVLFTVIVNDSKVFSENPTQQKSIYSRYNLLPAYKEAHRCKRQKKVRRGVKAPEWQEVPDYIIQEFAHAAPPSDNVVPLRKDK